MSRRGARLVVAVLFAVACGAAAWQHLRLGRALTSQTEAASAFDDQSRALASAIVELRAAQQAYVAAGQGLDYWTTRVSRDVGSLRSRLGALRGQATTAEGAAMLDGALGALEDFARMDGRAREHAVADQRLLASDLIFGDGLDMTQSIRGDLDRARHAEAAARAQSAARLRRHQALLGAGVGGLGLFFLLILAFTADPPPPAAAEALAAPASFSIAPPPNPERRMARAREETPSHARPSPPQPTVNLSGTAELCQDLARVDDPEQIPALLERACLLLDARGIVLWIADPEGRELVPTVAHGYAAAAVARLGAIGRDADNATAAAFRERKVRTVNGNGATSGAIVAPLVAPGGCVGVMAAEIRHGREQRDEVRAVATILAAQLATLIGVAPVGQTHARAN